MRILIIGPFFPPKIGGVEKVLYYVAKSLKKKGYEVTVVVGKPDEKAKDHEFYDGIEVYRIKNTIPSAWLFFLKHLGLIRKSDMVHAHGKFFWYFPFRFLFPLKPVLTVYHGAGPNLKLWERIIRRIAIGLSYDFLFVGRYAADRSRIKCPDENIIFVGVEVADIKKFRKKGDVRKLYFVGRLDKDRGAPEFIEGYRRYVKKYKDKKLQLTLLGGGELEEKLRKETKEKNIKFLGFTTKVYENIRNGEVVLSDGWLGTLEAMALGKIAVSHRSSWMEEIIENGKNGFMIEDPDDFADLIHRLVLDKELREGIQKNAIKFVKNFTWDRYIQKYLKITERALKLPK